MEDKISIREAVSNVKREEIKFLPQDEYVFIGKIALLLILLALSYMAIIADHCLIVLVGELSAGVLFAHAVELQHQVLHGTAFKSKKMSRFIGFFLGVPMMVSYSRYRALHMLRHRFLGTDKDTEFFEYASDGKLSLWSFLVSAFNFRRWLKAGFDMIRSFSIKTKFDDDIKDVRVHCDIRFEYQGMFVILIISFCLSLVFGNWWLVKLWFIPLVVG